jgi:signal transduction histidine kinase/HAMP domain-containing protein
MHRLLQPLRSQIRYKIILPYILLTIVVMLAGASIALSLAAATVQDRFNNEVTRVARTTNDAVFKREQGNLVFLWELAFAQANPAADAPAVAEAMAATDVAGLRAALEPYYLSGARQPDLEIDRLVAFDTRGLALVDWSKALDSAGQPLSDDPLAGRVDRQASDFSSVPGVQKIIANQRDAISDKYSGLLRSADDDDNLFFYTAVPVRASDDPTTPPVGGLLVAQRLDHMLNSIETTTSRADITTIYDINGQALVSTRALFSPGVAPVGLAQLDLDAETIEALSTTPPRPEELPFWSPGRLFDLFGGGDEGHSVQSVKEINLREYQIAYSPLTIRRSQVGFISAGLSRDFLVSAWSTNRNAIIAITLGLVGGAVLTGVWVARQITRPLSDLVSTAEAVTSGNLQARADTGARDELGTLARSFNQMTDYLLNLYQGSRQLSSRIEVERVLSTAQEAAGTFAPGTVALGLLETREGWAYALPAQASPHLRELLGRTLPRDEPLLAELARPDAQRVLLHDDPAVARLGLEHSRLQSFMVAPLAVDGRPVGALVLGHPDPQAFTGSAATAIESVANMSVTVLYNATLYRQVQEESREREAILQSIADGVVVLDEHRQIVMLNSAAATMLDLRRVSGPLPAFDSIRLEPVTAPQDLFGRDAAPAHFRTPRGRAVRLSSAPVRMDDGRKVGEVIVLHDISAEVAIDEAKTNFIGTVSHELRTPLTVIRGYLDLLARGLGGPLSPDQSELVHGARDRAQQMTELIQNVITIADIEAGKVSVQPQPQDIWLAVEGVTNAMRPSFAAKGLELRVNLPEALPMVMADRQHLQQILHQLLDNAQRYTVRGAVTVAAYQQDGDVRIDVSDTGPGIPQEQLAKLFTRFYRIEGNSSAERGSGLGLAITKHLVERQGGAVWVQSEPGHGSTFSFSLPLADEHAIAIAESGGSPAS